MSKNAGKPIHELPNLVTSPKSEPVRIIADVDTGIDDMLALLYLAARHRLGEIELVAVSSSAGNVEAWQTARNTRYILDLCSLPEIPVYLGACKPLRIELTTTPETHGEWGIGYYKVPETYQAEILEAEINQCWEQAFISGKTNLLVTGPLTLLAQNLEAANKFATITVMGGAVDYPGNTTAKAEWNFWVDPDAAGQVLSSNLPIRLCSLGVTDQMIITPQVVDSWDLPKQIEHLVNKALRFYYEFHQSQGIGYLAQVHDIFAAQVATGIKYAAESCSLRLDPEDRGAVKRVSSSDSDNSFSKGHDPDSVFIKDLCQNVELITQIEVQKVLEEFSRVLPGLR